MNQKILCTLFAILSFVSGKPIEADACLNHEFATTHYKECCTNNQYKIEGRKDVCFAVSRTAKQMKGGAQL